MHITESMNLDDLADRMGSGTEPHEAEAMRDVLVEFHCGEDTNEIDDREWLKLLDMAAAP